VWNRTRAQAEPRAASGAHVVDALTDLTACDIVFTMVSTGTDVKEVLVGTYCVTSTGKAPQIVVDSTSMALAESADIRAKLAAQGVQFLGRTGAHAHDLTPLLRHVASATLCTNATDENSGISPSTNVG
jgi:3-hydroxyisobutyrate dehydrogenase-like beta-hydroxyacid dehydrogenase